MKPRTLLELLEVDHSIPLVHAATAFSRVPDNVTEYWRVNDLEHYAKLIHGLNEFDAHHPRSP